MIDTNTWLCGPPSAKGQRQHYPGRFLYNLKRHYPMAGVGLEMFSGASSFATVTTDIRAETGADHIGPYDKLPWVSQFDWVLADPPYTMGFANEWVTLKKDVPKPKWVLREAAKAVRPLGLIFILHVIVIPAYKELKVERIALHPILCGPNNAIRVLNVFRKQ